MRRDHLPLLVGGVACIAEMIAPILRARDFSPGHGVLLGVFANTRESQPLKSQPLPLLTLWQTPIRTTADRKRLKRDLNSHSGGIPGQPLRGEDDAEDTTHDAAGQRRRTSRRSDRWLATRPSPAAAPGASAARRRRLKPSE